MNEFDTAVDRFRNGEYADAIRLFSSVPEASPFRGRALIGIGRAQYLLGDYQDAVASFDMASPIAGDKAADAAMYKAIALAALGRFTQGIQAMDEAIALGAPGAEKFYNRGQIYMRMARFGEAERDFMSAHEAAPDDDRNLTSAALAAAEGGFLERAVDRCRGVLSRNPRSSSALNVLSIAEARLGRLSDALSHSTMAIESARDQADYYYNRGRTFQALKDMPQAIADYSRAIELRPMYAKAYTNRGNCLLANADLAGALADFSSAISLGDTISYFNRGNVHIKRGDMDSALADFDQSIRHHSNHRDSYVARSLVNRELGREQNSISDYKIAMKMLRSAGDGINGDGTDEVG